MEVEESAFADDLVVYAGSGRDLQESLNMCETA